MMQSKTKLHFLPLFFIIYLGLLLMMNVNQVMAMNNGHVNNDHNMNNNHSDAELQARILQDLNLQQTQLLQQIFNARANNASEQSINDLLIKNMRLTQSISAQQVILHNTMIQQPNHPDRSNNSRRN
ncbi:MAG: SVM family protein [Candidatus Phytoplasma australasiaticum]|nr:SVM family protein [Candidatus Phytoplasma australasiaticum]MDV3199770.1 SVM family protein [Candidatus Phytoplasma australasiaticum]